MAQTNSTRDVIPAFAGAVRASRTAKGLTLAQVAERAGTSLNTVARLERGERGASLRLALRLAKALGTTVDRLAKGWDSEAETSAAK